MWGEFGSPPTSVREVKVLRRVVAEKVEEWVKRTSLRDSFLTGACPHTVCASVAGFSSAECAGWA
jgi:hypothetical protein